MTGSEQGAVDIYSVKNRYARLGYTGGSDYTGPYNDVDINLTFFFLRSLPPTPSPRCRVSWSVSRAAR